MAQASMRNNDSAPALKRHFALGEEQQYRLHKLSRVVTGLQALSHDGCAETAREGVEVAREDLAALFELIGEQIDHATANMPFVSSH